VLWRQRLETDEQAAQARLGGMLDQIAAQDAVDGGGPLEQAVHALHAVEESAREARIAEQMVVEEIEVAPGQPRDFGQRGVDALRVEGSPALEERILVAEVAVHRATARHDDRVRHEVAAPLDEIAAQGRNLLDGPARRRSVDRLCASLPEVAQ